MTKRILGIDPGSQHLGFGCIETKGARFVLVTADIISAPQRLPLYERLRKIGDRLDELLEEWRPAEVAIEDLFYAENVRSAFNLGMARGVAIGSFLRKGLPLFEYAPTQVKSVVTGYGRADKLQVKKMVELTLGTSVDLGYDATDSLAVAICHSLLTRRTEG